MSAVTAIATVERCLLAAFGTLVIVWALVEHAALSIDGVSENRVVFLGDDGGGLRGVGVIVVGGSGIKEMNITGANDLVLRDAAGGDALDRDEVYADAVLPGAAVPAAENGSWLEDRGLR